MRKYECMFLLDSAEAQKDFDALRARVDKVLERYGAKVLIGGLWDDRKLAYPVRKQRRGAYYLAYVDCAPDQMAPIREDLAFVEVDVHHDGHEPVVAEHPAITEHGMTQISHGTVDV